MPRTPTPKKILQLRGSRQLYERKNEPEPTIPITLGPPPDWLPGEEARKYWQQIGTELHAAGIVTVLDKVALGLLVEAFVQYLEAKAVIDREGTYQETNYGLSAHPALREMRSARDALLKFMIQFGMTPSARAGIIARPPEEDKSSAKKFFTAKK